MFVIKCCATNELETQWLRMTINIYYLQPFLWVRNSGVASLGGPGSEFFMRPQSSEGFVGLENSYPRQMTHMTQVVTEEPCFLSTGHLRVLLTRWLPAPSQ